MPSLAASHRPQPPQDSAKPQAHASTDAGPVPRSQQYTQSPPEPATVTRARIALCARLPISIQEMDKLASERRRQSIRIGLTSRIASSAVLLTTGTGLAAWGETRNQLWWLLGGYAMILLGLTVGSMLLATTLARKRQLLTRFYEYDEYPASESELQTLDHAMESDPELAQLIRPWRRASAPIRRSDIALAMAFKQAKQAAKMEYWRQQGRR